MKKIATLSAVLFLVLVLLSSCGKETYKDGYADGYSDGYLAAIESVKETEISFAEWSNAKHNPQNSDDFRVEYPKEKPVLALPISGEILYGKETNGSQITVTSDSDSSYVVSLKNSAGTECLSFFVRPGDTVTIGVPAEHLYVYFASGTTWYGYGKGLMFGENTVYSKDDEILDFTQYEWEYTLFPVYDGNFSETPSDADEFFG